MLIQPFPDLSQQHTSRVDSLILRELIVTLFTASGEFILEIVASAKLFQICHLNYAFIEVCPWLTLRLQVHLKISTVPFHAECPGCPYRPTVPDILSNVEKTMDG